MTVVELGPIINDAIDASAARNSPAAIAACDAFDAAVAANGEAGCTINGVNHRDSPDAPLRDLWADYWDQVWKFIDAVRKTNAPILVVPAFPE